MRAHIPLLSAVAAGLVALGGLRWLDLHPWTFAGVPQEAEVAGAPPPAADRGDVLVLLDAARIERAAAAGSFAALDPSCAWLNLLEAEFGPVSVALDAGADVAGHRAVVVTPSALPSVDRERLEAFAAGGGVVFLDGVADIAEFEPVAGGLLPGGAVDDADRAAFAALGPEFAGDGGPRFFARRVGRGRVVAFVAAGGDGASVARLHVTMVQGRPAKDDFTLVERHGDYPDIVEPDDLVHDPRLRENEVPFADLFARAVASLLDPPADVAPALPRLLWFPAGSTGVVLATHDEDLRGGAASLALSEWDARLGLKATVFAIAHPRLAEDWLRPRDFAAAIAASGGAVGLHWNQYPMPAGLGPVEPVAFVRTCAEQAAWLRALSPATERSALNRNHYLILHPHWSRTFRILAAQGVRLDSTFGANKGRGYLFGTARPYRILDVNGGLLPVRELPFVNQEDWGGADGAFFERLFAANAARHHGAVVTLFHPHLVVQEEAGRRLYERMSRAALDTGHAPFSFDEMLRFWESRTDARMRSRVEDGALVVSVAATGGRHALGLPWGAAGAGQAGEPVAHVDGRRVPVARMRVGAREFAVVALPGGAHEVRFGS